MIAVYKVVNRFFLSPYSPTITLHHTPKKIMIMMKNTREKKRRRGGRLKAVGGLTAWF